MAETGRFVPTLGCACEWGSFSMVLQPLNPTNVPATKRPLIFPSIFTLLTDICAWSSCAQAPAVPSKSRRAEGNDLGGIVGIKNGYPFNTMMHGPPIHPELVLKNTRCPRSSLPLCSLLLYHAAFLAPCVAPLSNARTDSSSSSRLDDCRRHSCQRPRQQRLSFVPRCWCWRRVVCLRWMYRSGRGTTGTFL